MLEVIEPEALIFSAVGIFTNAYIHDGQLPRIVEDGSRQADVGWWSRSRRADIHFP